MYAPAFVQLVRSGTHWWLAVVALVNVCWRAAEAKQRSAVLLSAGNASDSVHLARRSFGWGFNVMVLKRKKRTCRLADEVRGTFLDLLYLRLQHEFCDVWACASRG